MIKECLQFLRDPAKNLKIHLKESRRRTKIERRESLTESQLFVMELARELSWICQKADVLAHIWTGEDTWPPAVCDQFIMEIASILEMKENVPMSSLIGPEVCVERRDWRERLVCLLEGEENNLSNSKRAIMDWTHSQRNMHPCGIWPGEGVLLVLDDMEMQWKRGRLRHLQAAVELLIWVALAEHLDKELIPRLWLVQKQRSQAHGATSYIPHTVWNWICHAAVDVTLDPDTAHPCLFISEDGRRMRSSSERRDIPQRGQRFDGWPCALALQGFACGRHYWEVEVGDRDWRVGVACGSAFRRGYGFLTTAVGYYTLRLERGSELKAMGFPVTPLSLCPKPRRVGVHLDYDEGQLSFYDVHRRSHLYTFTERFTGTLFPIFGTAEMLQELVLSPASVRVPCHCRGTCLFG
ncbi:E3 ubiquitin-protein ligase TRIM21 [Hoplias malabaricus]|uniref:E3 ubiquitin-protein ligase TRIM21 n=1 Tax=Hoplias malabaricus TaxID=27720 RepID=UPI003462B6EF